MLNAFILHAHGELRDRPCPAPVALRTKVLGRVQICPALKRLLALPAHIRLPKHPILSKVSTRNPVANLGGIVRALLIAFVVQVEPLLVVQCRPRNVLRVATLRMILHRLLLLAR